MKQSHLLTEPQFFIYVTTFFMRQNYNILNIHGIPILGTFSIFALTD